MLCRKLDSWSVGSTWNADYNTVLYPFKFNHTFPRFTPRSLPVMSREARRYAACNPGVYNCEMWVKCSMRGPCPLPEKTGTCPTSLGVMLLCSEVINMRVNKYILIMYVVYYIYDIMILSILLNIFSYILHLAVCKYVNPTLLCNTVFRSHVP